MSDPVVELKSGFVRGVIQELEDGFNYYAFKGIPYAEPPIGELRFADGVNFGLGVDDKSSSPLVTVHPDYMEFKGIHLPCLIGCTSHEAIAGVTGKPMKEFLESGNTDFEVLLKYNLKSILARHGLTAQQVRRLYFKNEPVSDQNLDKYVNLISDLSFVEGVHKFTKIQAEQSGAATYLYVFNYISPKSFGQALAKYIVRGAGHFDDLSYLFKMRVFDIKY